MAKQAQQVNSNSMISPSTDAILTYDRYLFYVSNGLTALSNDTDLVPRDSAGNVIIDAADPENQVLIIEPVVRQITQRSFLNTIDTAFSYFSFPVTTTPPIEAVDLTIDLPETGTDIIYARYKPSEDRKIEKGSDLSYSAILMDEIEDGLPQKNTNAYYINKEIKNSGKDLRIRIAVQHRYDTSDADETSNVLFSLIKTNVDTGIDRTYRLYPEDTKAMSQYQVKTLIIDDVLLNSEFAIGDTFSIGAVCGIDEEFKYHTINAVTSYWIITDNSKNVDEWNQEIKQEEAAVETTDVTNPAVETTDVTNQIVSPLEIR
jgi:hypothetical protein